VRGAASQHLSTVGELKSALNALKVFVGDFPATAHKHTEILLGTPSADGLRVALDAPCCGCNAARFGLSDSGLLWIKGARRAANSNSRLT